jgi:hypothetical protein
MLSAFLADGINNLMDMFVITYKTRSQSFDFAAVDLRSEACHCHVGRMLSKAA